MTCKVCDGDKIYDWGDDPQGESQYAPCPFCTVKGRALAIEMRRPTTLCSNPKCNYLNVTDICTKCGRITPQSNALCGCGSGKPASINGVACPSCFADTGRP